MATAGTKGLRLSFWTVSVICYSAVLSVETVDSLMYWSVVSVILIDRCNVRWNGDIRECGNTLSVEVEGEINFISFRCSCNNTFVHQTARFCRKLPHWNRWSDIALIFLINFFVVGVLWLLKCLFNLFCTVLLSLHLLSEFCGETLCSY